MTNSVIPFFSNIRLPLVIVGIIIAVGSARAQRTVTIGGSEPNDNAVLRLVAPDADQGLLVPSLTTAQRTASSFTARLNEEDNGLLVYDAELGRFYYWYNGRWIGMFGNFNAGMGQVMKWDGNRWVAADDIGQVLNAGNGITIRDELIFIPDAGVTGSMLQEGSVSNQALANNAISTLKLRDSVVTNDKLSDDAVNTNNLVNDAVTTEKLAVGAVMALNLADSAVSRSKLARNAVTSSKIASGAVTAGKLGDESVSTVNLQDSSVTSEKLAENSIDVTKINSGSFTNSLLYVEDDGDVNWLLPGRDQVIVTNDAGQVAFESRSNFSNNALDEGFILIGNVNNEAQPQILSGDISLAPGGTGTVTISDDAITGGKIDNSAVGDGLSIVGGQVELGGGLSVNKTINTNGNTLTINNASGAFAVGSGATTIGGTLAVSSTATFSGNADISGSLDVTNQLNVGNRLTVSGEAVINGTSNFNSRLNANSGLVISGSPLEVNTTTINPTNGNLQVGGTLNVFLGAEFSTTDGITLANTVTEFSTDTLLLSNSPAALPTESAVKTYVDNEIETVNQLPQGHVFVGDNNNVKRALDARKEGYILVGTGVTLESVPLQGDAEIDNTGAVTLKDNTVATAKIQNDAITNAKLATNSVTNAKILDNEITDADINSSAAISRSKLANGTPDFVLINDASGVMSEEAQLAVSRGGTGASTAAGARTNLGLGTIAQQNASDFLRVASNLSDLDDATAARVNLGVNIGTDVQAHDADLDTYAGITPEANIQTFLGSADNVTARTNLGLGTLATQDANSVALTGGSIDGLSIGGTTAATQLVVSGANNHSITSTNNAAGAVSLTTNGGTSETLELTSTQGTAANAIGINASAGGVAIDAAEDITLTPGGSGNVIINNGSLEVTSLGDGTSRTYDESGSGTSLTINPDGIFGSSDRRLKDNIAPLNRALERVKQVNGVSYTFKNDESGRNHMGVIAQDIEKVFPELVNTNEQGYKSVNYTELIPLLLEAIKDQQALIDQLMTSVKSEEVKMKALRAQLQQQQQLTAVQQCLVQQMQDTNTKQEVQIANMMQRLAELENR